MTAEEITTLIEGLGDITGALGNAEPTDKADLYQKLGLRLTYDPDARSVHAEADLAPKRWATERVGGGT